MCESADCGRLRELLAHARGDTLREAAEVAVRVGCLVYDDMGQHAAQGAYRVAEELHRMSDGS